MHINETQTVDNTVYVFDVDGVLCNIGEAIHPEVITWLARLLEKPAFVAINTGRGYDRVGSEVVALVRAQLTDVSSLDRLFVSTEMGGVTTTFTGGREVHRQTEYKISTELQERAVAVYEQTGASKTMYEYDSKQSMTTFEKHDHVDHNDFEQQKSLLVEKLQQELQGEDVVIATTVVSIDVYNRRAGKNAGAQLIEAWVKSVSDLHHDAFICFGDSNNDYEMARYFAQQDATTTFVFTGENLVADEHSGVTVVDTVGRYTAGTLEYLSRTHSS